MRCIFCKSLSDDSVSSEHILPESIGNKEVLLPPGVVCDNCNNYLSREVEKPVIGSGIFRFIRSEQRIASKKGKVPLFEYTLKPELPDYRIMGRFIGKIGLELMAERVIEVPGWNDKFVQTTGLDELREFVRFNTGDEWPFIYRTLYPVNAIFKVRGKFVEMLNEFDILLTNIQTYGEDAYVIEVYVILVLFGVEFAMNLGDRGLDGYRKWLEQHNWESPLYVGKNLSDSELDDHYIE